MKNKYNLSVSEKEIMDLLWENGEMSSKEILHYFNTEKNKDWKKQTLNTFISRLLKKQVLKRRSVERKYMYMPAFPRHEYEARRAQNFLDMSYEGSIVKFISTAMQVTPFSKEEKEELLNFLDSMS